MIRSWALCEQSWRRSERAGLVHEFPKTQLKLVGAEVIDSQIARFILPTPEVVGVNCEVRSQLPLQLRSVTKIPVALDGERCHIILDFLPRPQT